MEDFEAIYRRHLMEVYRYLLKISGSPDVAEELTQQTFAIAFEKLGRFQERGKTIVWLCQIAKLEYYAWCRKNRVRTERLDEELEEKGGCQLRCSTAHPKVTITIEGETVVLDRTYNSCYARLVGGEIFLM